MVTSILPSGATFAEVSPKLCPAAHKWRDSDENRRHRPAAPPARARCHPRRGELRRHHLAAAAVTISETITQRRYADVAIIGVLLTAVAVLLVRQSDLGPSGAKGMAIAVLPFENLVRAQAQAERMLANNSAADNLRNLFEIPVLFFAICLALYVTGFFTPLQESLALGFVMLRTVHSFVHTTYNRVTDRFLAYAVSTLFVFAMWGLFALDLAR